MFLKWAEAVFLFGHYDLDVPTLHDLPEDSTQTYSQFQNALKTTQLNCVERAKPFLGVSKKKKWG